MNKSCCHPSNAKSIKPEGLPEDLEHFANVVESAKATAEDLPTDLKHSATATNKNKKLIRRQIDADNSKSNGADDTEANKLGANRVSQIVNVLGLTGRKHVNDLKTTQHTRHNLTA